MLNALRSEEPERMIAVFDEGSVGMLHPATSEPSFQSPKQDLSANPATSAVAIGRTGSVIPLAIVEGTIMLYDCDWSGEGRFLGACCARAN
jgi:hypothetical protein